MFFLGLGMFVMIGGWWLLTDIGTWWVGQLNNWNYGMPRTYQVDAVVGHNDSRLHPSHFIALNLDGRVEIIEIPGGNPTHERVYLGPTLYSDNAGLIPVTVSFKDVNGDGKPDMLLHIQNQTMIYLNNGSQFQSPR